MFQSAPAYVRAARLALLSLGLLLSGCHAPWAGKLALAKPAVEAKLVWKHAAPRQSEPGTFAVNVLPSAVAVCGDRVMAVSPNGTLTSLDKITGSVVWTLALKAGRFVSPLCVADGSESIALANDVGMVFWVEKTGRLRWDTQVDSSIRSAPTFGNDLLFVQMTKGALVALNTQTGRQMWTTSGDHLAPSIFQLELEQGPVFFDDVVYAGFPDGTLECYDSTTGSVLGSFGFPLQEGTFPHVGTPVITGGALYVPHHTNGIYRFEVSEKKPFSSPTWSYLLYRMNNPHAGTVWADSSRKIVCTVLGVGGIHCLDANGHVLWRQLTWSLTSGLTAWNDMLIFSRKDNGIYGVRAETGAWMLHIPTQGKLVSKPVVAGDMLFFTDAKGSVSAYRLRPLQGPK